MNAYFKLMRLDKPVGIWLTLSPALWALWIASSGVPPLRLLLTFIVGAIIVRSAGCAINDYMDRELDPHVERTRTRPLAARTLTAKRALLVFFILGIIGLLLAWSLNIFSFLIALAAALLTTIYPLMKRIMPLPQLILGIVFNAGVLIAFSAVQSHIPPVGWLLYGAVIVWTLAYDTMYAMSDRVDDLKMGVYSSAILFGAYDTRIVAALQSLFLILMCAVGALIHATIVFYFSLIVAACICLYQQNLIKNRDRLQCFRAFLTAQYVGWAVLVGLIFSYLMPAMQSS